MTKTTKKSRRNMLFKILKPMLYVSVTCTMVLLCPVKQWNSNMTDYQKVSVYKYLLSDPNNVIIFIVLLLFTSAISISIYFIKQQK